MTKKISVILEEELAKGTLQASANDQAQSSTIMGYFVLLPSFDDMMQQRDKEIQGEQTEKFSRLIHEINSSLRY